MEREGAKERPDGQIQVGKVEVMARDSVGWVEECDVRGCWAQKLLQEVLDLSLDRSGARAREAMGKVWGSRMAFW